MNPPEQELILIRHEFWGITCAMVEREYVYAMVIDKGCPMVMCRPRDEIKSWFSLEDIEDAIQENNDRKG